MSAISSYQPRYLSELHQSGKQIKDFPRELQSLARLFEKAYEAWGKADKHTVRRLMPALIQVDAFLTATIHQDMQQVQDIDKVKLLALKAKALLYK